MNRKQLAKVIYVCISLLLVLVIVYSGLRILESAVFLHQGSSMQTTSKTIVRDGVKYYPRQDINVILVLGIDEEGPVQDSGSYNNPGASDVVMLMIVDETQEVIDVLSLNRDTMVEMPVLGIGGKQAGTTYAQLALAHTYGNGLEESCENTRTTVSNLLGGIQIDHYVSMNMDALSILNDAVGGVVVNVTDDFSAVDTTIGMGEVRLQGQQAITYVRARHNVGDQLNLSRMERQKEYVAGWARAFREGLKEDPTMAVTAYSDVEEYIVTDCSMTLLTALMERYAEYSLGEIVTPEGENVKGEKYYEFHLDEEALDALVIDMFYKEKQ